MFYEDGVLDLRKDRDQGIFITEAQKAGAYRKRLIRNTHWGINQRRQIGNCKRIGSGSGRRSTTGFYQIRFLFAALTPDFWVGWGTRRRTVQAEIVEDLVKLAALRETGMLTADEYAAAKRKLLG